MIKVNDYVFPLEDIKIDDKMHYSKRNCYKVIDFTVNGFLNHENQDKIILIEINDEMLLDWEPVSENRFEYKVHPCQTFIVEEIYDKFQLIVRVDIDDPVFDWRCSYSIFNNYRIDTKDPVVALKLAESILLHICEGNI